MSVYTVYRTTNVMNGMFYIGVHKTKDPNDDYLGSGKRLKYALAKYGVENFKKEVLFIFSTREEAYSKEKELVTEETLDSGKCYNLKLGGEGGWDYTNKNYNTDRRKASGNIRGISTRFSKEKQAAICLGKIWITNKITNKLIHPTDDIPLGWIKGITKIKSNRDNFTHSEETKRKMKESSIGKHEGSKNSQFGSKWITDGILNKKIKKDQEIPEGWRRGRI